LTESVLLAIQSRCTTILHVHGFYFQNYTVTVSHLTVATCSHVILCRCNFYRALWLYFL